LSEYRYKILYSKDGTEGELSYFAENLSEANEKILLLSAVSIISSPALDIVSVPLAYINNQGVSSNDLLFLIQSIRELHIGAEVPLPRAMEVLGSTSDQQNIRDMCNFIAVAMSSGLSFSHAVHIFSSSVPSSFIEAMELAEKTGSMEVALDALERVYTRNVNFVKSLKAALVTPSISLSMAYGIVTMMMTFFVPSLTGNMEMDVIGPYLDKFTLTIIAFSDWTNAHIYLYLTYSAMILALIIKSSVIYGHFPDIIKSLLTRLPIINGLVINNFFVFFYSNMSLMAISGRTFEDSLRQIANSVSNPVMRKKINEVVEYVSAGHRLSDSLGRVLISSYDEALISVAENSGTLPERFLKMEAEYGERIDSSIGNIKQAISILLLLFVACVIVATFLTMFAILDAQKLAASGIG